MAPALTSGGGKSKESVAARVAGSGTAGQSFSISILQGDGDSGLILDGGNIPISTSTGVAELMVFHPVR
jgi:hypothetical protein